MTALIGTLSADGAGEPIFLPTGAGTFIASGTFGSGTIALQVKLAAGGFLALTSISMTAAGHIAFDLQAPAVVRVSLSGATGPTLLWEIRPDSKC